MIEVRWENPMVSNAPEKPKMNQRVLRLNKSELMATWRILADKYHGTKRGDNFERMILGLEQSPCSDIMPQTIRITNEQTDC